MQCVNPGSTGLEVSRTCPGCMIRIIGASRMQHLEDAVQALEIELTGEELKALAGPCVPHPVAAHA